MDGGRIAAGLGLAAAFLLFGLTIIGEASLLLTPHEETQKRGGLQHLYAQMLAHLQASLPRTQAILYGTQVFLAIAALVATIALVDSFPQMPWGAVAGSVAAVALLLAVLQKLLRRMVQQNGRAWTLGAAPWLFFLYLLGSPIHRLLSFGGPSSMAGRPSEQGIQTTGHLAQAGAPQHEEHEQRMIQSILELDTTTVREIMTPRVDLVAVPVDASPTTLTTLMVERGHSRIPLFDGTIDHIVGIVYARDLLKFLTASVSVPPLKSLARPALFVPESKRLNELLKEFQQQRAHSAIVVDEYGGTAGIVTIEDLLEEVVGEMSDEFSSDEPPVQMLGDGKALVRARTSLETVNELFGSSLASDEMDTLGGYVFGLLGKLPAVGDSVTAGGLKLEVTEVTGRRIRKVRVLRQESPFPTDELE